LGPWLALLGACIFFATQSDRFLTGGNLSLILQQVMVVGVIAIGQTLIILTAGIDLSCGMVMALGGIVMSKFATELGMPAPLAILCGIGVTTLFGLLNGLLVTRIKLPPFIVTLGTLNIAFAITQLYSSSQTITDLPGGLTGLGLTFTIGSAEVAWGSVLMVALYALAWFVLRETAAGRHIYAVGNNAEATRLVGIPTQRVLLGVYVAAGAAVRHCLAAVGGAHRRGRPECGADGKPRRHHRRGARRHQPLRRARHRAGLADRRAHRGRVPQRAHADGRVVDLPGAGDGRAGDSCGGRRPALAQGSTLMNTVGILHPRRSSCRPRAW
jgi:ribose/xylose/arabinose/galactoside ABC-type transport system permease subunit